MTANLITALITLGALLSAAVAALFVQNRRSRESAARAKISDARVVVADKVTVAVEKAAVAENAAKAVAREEFDTTMATVEETKSAIDAAADAGDKELADAWNKHMDERR